MTKSNTWGGKREGAGRKAYLPEGARNRGIICTDDEFLHIKAYLQEIRSAVPQPTRYAVVYRSEGSAEDNWQFSGYSYGSVDAAKTLAQRYRDEEKASGCESKLLYGVQDTSTDQILFVYTW